MKKYWKKLWLVLALVSFSSATLAHHILGRPSYNLGDDSNTPPSMQVETQIGQFFVRSMVYPAFPEPGQSGRMNLYASNLKTGVGFVGRVKFFARSDALFADGHEDVLGEQQPDDGVFRQGFVFPKAGKYVITAAFEYDDEPYRIDFPITIGRPLPIGPVGITISVLILLLLIVNVVMRKRLLRKRVQAAHQDAQ